MHITVFKDLVFAKQSGIYTMNIKVKEYFKNFIFKWKIRLGGDNCLADKSTVNLYLHCIQILCWHIHKYTHTHTHERNGYRRLKWIS